jgi:hypothetical protein
MLASREQVKNRYFEYIDPSERHESRETRYIVEYFFFCHPIFVVTVVIYRTFSNTFVQIIMSGKVYNQDHIFV